MPNYCSNALIVTGDEAQTKEFLARIEKARGDRQDGIFNEFIPCPPELLAADAYANPPAWYTWRVKHWGTKWDVTHHNITFVTPTHLVFDTAWAPPTEFVQAVSLMYPLLKFELAFSERGMEVAGTQLISDGVVTDETVVPIEQEYNDETNDIIMNDEWSEHLKKYQIDTGG